MPAPSQTQSHLRHPLTALFGSTGHVRVLRALAHDRAPQSAPQLAAAAGLTPQGTRGVLDVLARQRLVKAHGSGRTQLYELNAAHPLASSLAALFHDEQGRWDALVASFRDVLDRQGGVSAAWLYGSVARGDDAPGSDVDIALVVRSQAVADQVREAFVPLEDAQQIRISLTALTARELAALPEDDPWWANVVRDGRVLKGAAPDQARRRYARAAA
jgi:predicted nucleotidyltransferase